MSKNDLTLVNSDIKIQETPQNSLVYFVRLGWARLPRSLLGKYSSVRLGLSVANNSPAVRVSVCEVWLWLRKKMSHWCAGSTQNFFFFSRI